MAESDYDRTTMVETIIYTILRSPMKKEDNLPHLNTGKYRSQETVPGTWSNSSNPYSISQPITKATGSDGLEVLDRGRKVKTPGRVATSLELHVQVITDRMIITTGDGFNTNGRGENKEADYLNVYDSGPRTAGQNCEMEYAELEAQQITMNYMASRVGNEEKTRQKKE